MGQIKADIKSVVENIGKNVVFMQPLYETITNSLEANAKNIEIFISEEEKARWFGIWSYEGIFYH